MEEDEEKFNPRTIKYFGPEEGYEDFMKNISIYKTFKYQMSPENIKYLCDIHYINIPYIEFIVKGLNYSFTIDPDDYEEGDYDDICEDVIYWKSFSCVQDGTKHLYEKTVKEIMEWYMKYKKELEESGE